MIPFTPRGKSNLSAWMVARSDGEHYGKLGVYTFPKQKLIYGPNQIVARINQEAEISRQISLWDQRGSSVIQGNLLVIPIEESLIYVRPLYLKADAGKIPELKRVIVGYEDNIAMERTLEEALQKIFGGMMRRSEQKMQEQMAEESPQLQQRFESDGDKIVLSQSDYQRIRKYFDRMVQSQTLLDQSVTDYKKDLEALGEALGKAEVGKEKVPEALPKE